MLEQLAESIAQSNQNKPRYVGKVGDKYIGYDYNLVSTKQNALTMVTDDLFLWESVSPFDLDDATTIVVERYYRKGERRTGKK